MSNARHFAEPRQHVIARTSDGCMVLVMCEPHFPHAHVHIEKVHTSVEFPAEDLPVYKMGLWLFSRKNIDTYLCAVSS